MNEPESTDLEPHVSMRSLVLGAMLAMIGLLFFAGFHEEASLRATRVLTSVAIAGAAGGAAFSMLAPWRESGEQQKWLRHAASVVVYGAAVIAGFLAARFGPF